MIYSFLYGKHMDKISLHQKTKSLQETHLRNPYIALEITNYANT